ncbi:MAG: hypothetical protein M1820_003438 [Bogoriella megaspora]|nr:MAG: hypothetical protein M1820_003438 [Bogoriella megaspora]
MNGSTIKDENETIKSEFKSSNLADNDDDDIYEDTGELKIPAVPSREDAVWLARVPDYLWEALSGLNDDDEIEIGKMRIWGNDKIKIDLYGRKELSEVPKAYDLNMINQNLNNTYVFSEKNQSNYRPFEKGQKRAFKDADGEFSRESKRKRLYANAIPKQTALVGHALHELNCLAVENAEYRELMAKRLAKIFEPKHKTTYLNNQDAARQLYNSAKGELPFIVHADKPKKPQENKFVRMEKEQLTPWLISLFGDYKYWGMKRLRVQTKQPEAWLKECLQDIAYMVKSGPFANLWTLKEEYSSQVSSNQQKGEANGDAGIEDDDIGSDEDDFKVEKSES